jgi:hypothetical protein
MKVNKKEAKLLEKVDNMAREEERQDVTKKVGKQEICFLHS